MTTLESPTALTRGPPLNSLDLPESPAPSRDSCASIPPAHPQSPALPVSGNGADSASTSRDHRPKVGNEGEVMSRSKQPGADDGESQWRECLKGWKLLLTLENSGSVARDHLASERTFLAYTRTSLTIASTGVALVQLFTLSSVATDKDLERFGRPLGAVMIILGLVVLIVGVVRYFLVQDALIRGVYPVARISTSFLSFVLLALILVVFVIILVTR